MATIQFFDQTRADADTPKMSAREFTAMSPAERRRWCAEFQGKRDSQGLPIIEHTDFSGRIYREFAAPSMKAWMGPWMKPGQQQLRINNATVPLAERNRWAKWKLSGSTLNYSEWCNPHGKGDD